MSASSLNVPQTDKTHHAPNIPAHEIHIPCKLAFHNTSPTGTTPSTTPTLSYRTRSAQGLALKQKSKKKIIKKYTCITPDAIKSPESTFQGHLQKKEQSLPAKFKYKEARFSNTTRPIVLQLDYSTDSQIDYDLSLSNLAA